MNLKNLSKKLRLDLFFFIVGFLVFPIVIIISIYSIFSVKEDSKPSSYPMSDLSVSITEVSKQNSSVDNVTPPMTSSTNTIKTGHSEGGLKKSLANQNNFKITGEWNATQYTQGDIVKNTYLVQQGDTLWQISNAFYGNGAEWTKILESNKEKIAFLQSGEQALIYPGQVLTLP